MNTNKITISNGLKCKNCGQQTMYPVIYTKDFTFSNIIDKEPFICEYCGKHFIALKTDETVEFLEDVEYIS